MQAQENTSQVRWRASGQALIEYALILTLVVIALAAALIATGPALGNVFSNTVYNLLGQTTTPQDLSVRGGPAAFWQTVTAVALNPPQEKPNPTNPPLEPSTTPSPGPSPTPTPITPTPSPPPTATDKPTSTPTDFSHLAPFTDPIDHPEWWRVDSSVFIGGDDWYGEYYPNKDLSGTPDETLWNAELGDANKLNINFNWGTGGPIVGWLTNDFSVRWTRSIYVDGTNPLTIAFTVLSDNGVRLWVDSTLISTINQWNDRTFDSGPLYASYTLTPGYHTLKLEYYESTGTAGIVMNISSFKGNVLADTGVPSGAPNCQWARVTGTQPNTISWAWDESPVPGNGFPPNMRCHLELRGSVNLLNVNNPSISFWDVWDFAATTTAKLQIAEYATYNADGSGGPNWAAGTTITLARGTKNYAWTRNVIPIPAALDKKKITYRFILESGGGTGVRRWYIDDIEIREMPTRTFTVCSGSKASCGNFWSLDSTPQLTNDFITTGRWSLTNKATAESSPLALDVSATSGSRYVRFGSEQGSSDYRIHAVEFNGNMSFPFNADGSGGTPDFEGDDGFPQLTFYQAYDLDIGESIEIQYTRDARGTTPESWQTVQVLASAPSAAVSAPMDQVEVPLNVIPNWNTSPFRLRFALNVNASNTGRVGWFIDSIVLERKGVPRFSNYPFCDDAENGPTQWLMTGQWGMASVGYGGSGRSFTDSPAGNYFHGQETAMELRYPIDFNNDTPENLTQWGGNKDCNGNNSGAATRPVLTFWHYRSLAADESITVDLYRAPKTTPAMTAINWTPAWSYVYNSSTRIQLAWERIVIDLDSAVQQLTGGQSLSALKANANPYDDDFYIRVRLDSRVNSSVSDGLYVDNINIGEYTETSYKLWNTTKDAGGGLGYGNGARYVDDVDTPGEWWLRWFNGGSWTAIDWERHAGLKSFHDSPPKSTRYRHGTYSILEMKRIFDLRGTLTTDDPILYFWNRYETGDDDVIRVQIALEDPTQTTQNYNQERGWSAWTDVWSVGEYKTNNTWTREQVSLRTYTDNPSTTDVNEGKRIRLRFVMDAYTTSSGLRDGWYIDDVQIQFNTQRIIGLPFFDPAQNTQNWITEGIWGLAPDLWKGSGGGPAQLGSDEWREYWFDCANWNAAGVPQSQGSCDPGNTSSFFNRTTMRPIESDMNAYVSAYPTYALPQRLVSDIEYDFADTGRPPGAPTGFGGETWLDQYMGRWIRRIDVQKGEYTFITTSDDGVRLRYEPEATPDLTPPYSWNIINNWSWHGRTVDIKTVSLEAGSYKLTLEWFESGGEAVIMLQVGNNNFSFSDSPKPGASASIPAVASIPYGNSSLILDGLLNLTNPNPSNPSLWKPSLQYYTYWQLGSSGNARVEVSIDGGFTWTQNNLNQNCPTGANCDPNIWGWSDRMPNAEWEWRAHDLRAYSNKFIGLRFQLKTTDSVRNGWWITEIQVNN